MPETWECVRHAAKRGARFGSGRAVKLALNGGGVARSDRVGVHGEAVVLESGKQERQVRIVSVTGGGQGRDVGEQKGLAVAVEIGVGLRADECGV